MKTMWMISVIALSLLTFDVSAAKPKTSKKKSASALQTAQKKTTAKKSKLSTDVDFDGSTLHGRYQKSAESLATVESEKAMMDLLGNRKNFKDRLAKTGSAR